MDAVRLLADDHGRIRALFAAYDRAAGDAERRALAALVGAQLRVHLTLEQEVFYPAVARAVAGEAAQALGATLEHEHAAVAALTRRLSGLLREGAPFESALAQLRATVLDHCRAEEAGLFPVAQQGPREDLERLGWLLAGRQAQLVAELEAGVP
jgi:iron-sulfur cluster repair protein YtfE (RIC family)